MNLEEFKAEIKNMVGNDIKFDGHVNLVVNSIEEEKQKDIIRWIKNCKEGLMKPEPCKNFRQLISFIYKSNDNRIRGILTKEKNAYFIELFIDKHKYYDRKRKYLGL